MGFNGAVALYFILLYVYRNFNDRDSVKFACKSNAAAAYHLYVSVYRYLLNMRDDKIGAELIFNCL